MLIVGLITALISVISVVESLPDCDYVATNAFFYPIGACESDITDSIASSFKYICNDNGTIDKYIYNTFDCEGSVSQNITNMTELDIQSYSCENIMCDYAIACSFLECNTNENDTECELCAAESYSELLTENHDTQCRAYIKDQCLGTDIGYVYQCEGGVLSQYFKFSCNDTNSTLYDEFGGDSSTCKDEDSDDVYAYWTVDCDPFFLEPECNYAASNGHSYPIGACETDINEAEGDITSFKYVCNGNSVNKEIYSTLNCEGEPDETDTNPSDIDHYQCRSRDCSYAISCEFLDCGDSNECSTCSDPYYQQSGQIFNKHITLCRPWITNQCYGTDGFLQMSSCDASIGQLTVGVYGEGCEFEIFPTVFGGPNGTCVDDDSDGDYGYYIVDCNPTIIKPNCNFIAADSAPYILPIGGCESYINNGTMTSFKYVCDSDTNIPKKYVYNTFGCDGDDYTVSDVADLDYYQCDSIYGDCPYATECQYNDCGTNVNDTTCSICSATNYLDDYRDDHDAICRTYITDECFGSDDFLQYATCNNGKYTDNFYLGSNCDDGLFLYSNNFTDNECVYSSTYYTVDCTLRTTAFETTMFTSADITKASVDDSQANIASICIALIYANLILFISF